MKGLWKWCLFKHCFNQLCAALQKQTLLICLWCLLQHLVQEGLKVMPDWQLKSYTSSDPFLWLLTNCSIGFENSSRCVSFVKGRHFLWGCLRQWHLPPRTSWHASQFFAAINTSCWRWQLQEEVWFGTQRTQRPQQMTSAGAGNRNSSPSSSCLSSQPGLCQTLRS